MSLFCRSPSPSVEQCTRLRKTLAEEQCQSPDLKTHNRKSPELKGATASKLNEDYFGYSPPGASNRRHSKDFMEYGKQTETEQYSQGLSHRVTERPPSGKKDTKHRMKEKDVRIVYECETDPFSDTQAFKMDALSSVIQECEILQGQGRKKAMYSSNLATATGLPSNRDTRMSLMPPTSLPIRKAASSDMKTPKLPGQMSPQKSHPYRKPSSLYALSSGTHPTSFQITKRLPSPKVLMTASKKPEPSGCRKRCLDYSEEKIPQETSDDFSSFKHLEELTASDMQDLTRPLSPNHLDAYLSSLSNRLPKKSSLSQLDEIPMTKCRFFIGESEKSDDVFESPEVGIVETDKEALPTHEDDLKLKHTAQSLSQNTTARADNSSISSLSREGIDNSDLLSLSERSLLKGDDSEYNDFENFKKSLSQITTFKEENSNNCGIKTEVESNSPEIENDNKYSDTPELLKPVNFPTRRLFHKSLSTSEVEDDLTTRKSLKKVLHKLKTESRVPESYVENIQNTPHEKRENLKQEKSQSLKTSETDCISSADKMKIEYRKGEKAGYSKQEDTHHSSIIGTVPNKKPIRYNLDDIVIPCSVGSGTPEEPDSVSRSKSIEICANETNKLSQNGFSDLLAHNGSLSPINSPMSPKNESNSNSEGSPTPVGGSPNVDDEVLHHLKQSLHQSSQRQTSLKRGSSSDLPDIGLSLCKQLLRKGFQQSVENVSL